MTENAPNRPVPLPLGPVLAVGIGSLALAVVWSLYAVFMPLLLRDFVASRGLRGAIMGLDNLAALVLIPLVGTLSDGARHPRGKRLPFLLVLFPIAAVAFAALPLARGALWSLMLAALVFLLAMTASRAPLTASMPDHVAPDARSRANGVITMLGAVGTAVALVGLAPLFDRAPWSPFVVASVLLLAALAVLVGTVRPNPPYAGDAAVPDAPPLRTLRRDLAALLGRRPRGALLLLLAVFFGFLGFSALEAQFSTYATERLLLGEGQSGALLGAASVAFVLAAIPVGSLARRLGEVMVMRWGALALAAVSIVAAQVARPAALVPVLAAAGVAWALVVVPAYPAVVNQGPAEQSGFFTGIYYFAGSAAAIAAPASVGAAMDLFGDAALFYAIAVAMLAGVAALTLAVRAGLASSSPSAP